MSVYLGSRDMSWLMAFNESGGSVFCKCWVEKGDVLVSVFSVGVASVSGIESSGW